MPDEASQFSASEPALGYPIHINNSSEAIEAALRGALNHSSTESVSLDKICAKFGVSRRAIFRRFPQLLAAVVTKNRKIRRANVATNRKRREARLDQLLFELKKQGRATTKHQILMLMKSSGEGQTFQMLKLFKERFGTRHPCN
jgi:hypothetical protein